MEVKYQIRGYLVYYETRSYLAIRIAVTYIWEQLILVVTCIGLACDYR